jgi:hypothetical protein
MKENIKKLWLAALNSKAYVQGHGGLRRAAFNDDGSEHTVTLCPLGVLCDLHAITTREGEWCKGGFRYVVNGKDTAGFLPPEVAEWAGVDKIAQRRIVNLNDNSFSYAPAIEEIRTYM